MQEVQPPRATSVTIRHSRPDRPHVPKRCGRTRAGQEAVRPTTKQQLHHSPHRSTRPLGLPAPPRQAQTRRTYRAVTHPHAQWTPEGAPRACMSMDEARCLPRHKPYGLAAGVEETLSFQSPSAQLQDLHGYRLGARTFSCSGLMHGLFGLAAASTVLSHGSGCSHHGSCHDRSDSTSLQGLTGGPAIQLPMSPNPETPGKTGCKQYTHGEGRTFC